MPTAYKLATMNLLNMKMSEWGYFSHKHYAMEEAVAIAQEVKLRQHENWEEYVYPDSSMWISSGFLDEDCMPTIAAIREIVIRGNDSEEI